MDDEILIKSAAEGNEDSFKELIEKYKFLVFAICLNILKDKQEAENAAQETFLLLYKNLKNYEYKGFKTYISKIAINKSIDLRRKITLYGNNCSTSLDEIENNIPNGDISPQDKLIKKDEIEKLKEALNSIPKIYKETVSYYYIDELSYKEIATRQNISIKTVESRLSRGKKLLRMFWKEEF